LLCWIPAASASTAWSSEESEQDKDAGSVGTGDNQLLLEEVQQHEQNNKAEYQKTKKRKKGSAKQRILKKLKR
jgi:hypothetical protein